MGVDYLFPIAHVVHRFFNHHTEQLLEQVITESFHISSLRRAMMSGKRRRHYLTPTEVTKKFKLAADMPDSLTFFNDSSSNTSSIRTESLKVESAPLHFHLERRCSVSVDKAASLISETESLASRLEDLTYLLGGVSVESFLVEFSSALSGKPLARIESVCGLNIAHLGALSLRDLLATVFELKHKLVKEHTKKTEVAIVAYFRSLGLLEHCYVFHSLVSRWYCPFALHLPSISMRLGGSSPVTVTITSHDEFLEDSESPTEKRDLLVSINIVVDMNFSRTSLFVYLSHECDPIVDIHHSLEQRILLASSEPEFHNLRYTMHQKVDNGFVWFNKDDGQVEHTCSFNFPACMLELASLLPNYIEAISGMPHVGFFQEIARLRDDALWWSCPEQLVITPQNSTEILPAWFPITKSFSLIPEGWHLETGYRLNYSISKKNSKRPSRCCCLHERDDDDIHRCFFIGPELLGE